MINYYNIKLYSIIWSKTNIIYNLSNKGHDGNIENINLIVYYKK